MAPLLPSNIGHAKVGVSPPRNDSPFFRARREDVKPPTAFAGPHMSIHLQRVREVIKPTGVVVHDQNAHTRWNMEVKWRVGHLLRWGARRRESQTHRRPLRTRLSISIQHRDLCTTP